MIFSPDWLYHAAHTATELASFGLWTAGCVVALRQRPLPGSTLAAAGFGCLSLMEVVSLAFYLAFMLQVQLGGTGVGFPDALMLAINGLMGVARIAGTALVVAGVGRAWAGLRRDELKTLGDEQT